MDPVFGPILSMLSLTALLAYLWVMLACLGALLAVVFLPLACLALFFRFSLLNPRRDGLTVGFFHPYCNAGGGGERVLWVAVRAMERRFPDAKFVVYTGDVDAAPDQILSRAEERFNLSGLSAAATADKVEFVYLHRRPWVEAAKYPVFTLLGQSLGSIYLGLEALSHGSPSVYIDTMGYAFTLPIFRYLGNCHTACYVHYPTISTDMLDKVRIRRAGFNNRAFIANSAAATAGKLLYYKFFAWLYGWCGRCSDVTMVNSSWTEGHVAALWGVGDSLHRIYPPCDTAEFEAVDRKDSPDEFRILSLGQFRPEKDHPLQVRALALLRDKVTQEVGVKVEERERRWNKVKLVLAGGARNAQDEARVKDLKNLCRHLAVEDHVEFKVNVPFSELKSEMSRCAAGIHTMWNEHFGIAVVEMLSAGLVTVAHRSGGPLMDIVVEAPEQNRNGFLAVGEEEYADALIQILDMSSESRRSLVERARDSVRRRFSERQFEVGWVRATEAAVNRAAAASDAASAN